MLISSYTSTMLKGRGDWLKFRLWCDTFNKNAAYWMYRNCLLDAPKTSKLINLAQVGSLEGVQEYFRINPEPSILHTYALAISVENNHKDIVALMLSRNIEIKPEYFDTACRFGFKDILLMLLDTGSSISVEALRYAAEFGHEDLVDILIEHNAPLSWRAQLNAATPELKKKLDAYDKLVKEVVSSQA